MKAWTGLSGTSRKQEWILLCAAVTAFSSACSDATDGVATPREPQHTTQAATQAPRSIAGIRLNARLAEVQARCATEKWQCTLRTRTISEGEVQRLHVSLPTGEFARLIVVAKDSNVIGVRATYRESDPQRRSKLAVTYGTPSVDAGVQEWAWSEHTKLELAPSSNVLLLVGLDIAKQQGITFASRRFMRGKLPAKSLATQATFPQSLNIGQNTVQKSAQGLGELFPFEQSQLLLVRENERIDATFTLDKLRCNDENDATSIFSGDAPILKILGLHTASSAPWPDADGEERRYSDVESGDTRNVNLAIFGSDLRRVSRGESAGFHVALFEHDTVSDNDEIDFASRFMSFAELRAQAGNTVSGSLVFEGADAKYTLTYTVKVGQAVVAAPPITLHEQVNPSTWAGTYATVVDGRRSTASLSFVASTSARPQGSFVGSWQENGKTLTISTSRLRGNYVELDLFDPSSPLTAADRHMVAYLVGTGTTKAITGTAFFGADFKTGFYMTRTP